MRWILIVAIALAAGVAHADTPGPDTVALLPLATGKGFALYGQPVAAELARALRAAGVEVVVVSVGATPPARAKLVVDGTIASGPHGVVALEARVRDLAKGVVVGNVAASAPELGALDRAAADLSAQLVPVVKAQLAELDKPVVITPEPPSHCPECVNHPTQTLSDKPPAPPPLPAAIVFATSRVPEFPKEAAAQLARELVARTGHRAVDAPKAPDGKPVAGDFELAIDVLAYGAVLDGVWTARATARVRFLAPDGRELANRVVHTDTLVASRGEDRGAMVGYVAAQLADILRPRLAAWLAGRQ